MVRLMQELVTDVHCIIEAMIGADSGVQLLEPSTAGVPDMVRTLAQSSTLAARVLTLMNAQGCCSGARDVLH